ncbi:hypothetical protein HDU97_001081 [Phlyctochytrium planicorne]|nr:hypothetical protein HDU97_001081 [Phlyctochytrium planicorne]
MFRTAPLVVIDRGFPGFPVETRLEEPFINGQVNASRIVSSTLSLLSLAESILVRSQQGRQGSINVQAELDSIFTKFASLLHQSGITTSPQEFLVQNSIIGSYPLVARHLNLQYYSGQGQLNVSKDHFARMSALNQLTAMSLQLRNDLKLTNHKYIAHQLALLYQAINLVGAPFTKYHARIQSQFEAVKALTSDPNEEEPQLKEEQKQWLSTLTSDIVNEVLFTDVRQYVVPASLSQFVYGFGNK